ncbi:hypothetical protein [Streptomyces sp. NPDC005805]|uniref:hypothetical protein n=1 Tax=Streptomyces sp. NPDC005805 TaxID=3157068 RepID=UPI0033CDC547
MPRRPRGSGLTCEEVVAAGVPACIATLGAEGGAKCEKGIELRFTYMGRAKGGKCIRGDGVEG